MRIISVRTLAKYVAKRQMLPGETFTTTLLGPFPYGMVREKAVGEIPAELQQEAERYGLAIEAALVDKGAYVVRVVRELKGTL